MSGQKPAYCVICPCALLQKMSLMVGHHSSVGNLEMILVSFETALLPSQLISSVSTTDFTQNARAT